MPDVEGQGTGQQQQPFMWTAEDLDACCGKYLAGVFVGVRMEAAADAYGSFIALWNCKDRTLLHHVCVAPSNPIFWRRSLSLFQRRARKPDLALNTFLHVQTPPKHSKRGSDAEGQWRPCIILEKRAKRGGLIDYKIVYEDGEEQWTKLQEAATGEEGYSSPGTLYIKTLAGSLLHSLAGHMQGSYIFLRWNCLVVTFNIECSPEAGISVRGPRTRGGPFHQAMCPRPKTDRDSLLRGIQW